MGLSWPPRDREIWPDLPSNACLSGETPASQHQDTLSLIPSVVPTDLTAKSTVETHRVLLRRYLPSCQPASSTCSPHLLYHLLSTPVSPTCSLTSFFHVFPPPAVSPASSTCSPHLLSHLLPPPAPLTCSVTCCLHLFSALAALTHPAPPHPSWTLTSTSQLPHTMLPLPTHVLLSRWSSQRRPHLPSPYLFLRSPFPGTTFHPPEPQLGPADTYMLPGDMATPPAKLFQVSLFFLFFRMIEVPRSQGLLGCSYHRAGQSPLRQRNARDKSMRQGLSPGLGAWIH